MDKLKISANGPLNGEITVSGAKNAALPLMCAGLLTSGTLRLKNVPMLADVATTQKLLQGMGARVLTDNISEFEINGGTVNNTCAPYELVRTMR
ncbi:TPA: UDP-N-acetylglucosamine 1-carboxyvinyltransferase, partial [Neisseria gonorrhoeae]